MAHILRDAHELEPELGCSVYVSHQIASPARSVRIGQSEPPAGIVNLAGASCSVTGLGLLSDLCYNQQVYVQGRVHVHAHGYPNIKRNLN